ncbi:MAG: hypothetical protein JNK04_23310, partial [Myxococcales bacterium]|nr:hypothetical protein [Myxococcales bacterium]
MQQRFHRLGGVVLAATTAFAAASAASCADDQPQNGGNGSGANTSNSGGSGGGNCDFNCNEGGGLTGELTLEPPNATIDVIDGIASGPV